MRAYTESAATDLTEQASRNREFWDRQSDAYHEQNADLFVPEVARVLRAGGVFTFSGATPFTWVCFDKEADTWDERLHRDYFGMHRDDTPEGSIEFKLPHGEWIRLFGANGFEIEDLIEVQPPEGAASTYRRSS